MKNSIFDTFKPGLLDSEPFFYAKKYASQYNCDLSIASNVGLGSLVCFSPVVEAMALDKSRPIRVLTAPYSEYNNLELEGPDSYPVWNNNPYIDEIVNSDAIDRNIMIDVCREAHNFCQCNHIIENMLAAYNLRPRKLHGSLFLSKREMQNALKRLSHLPRPVICLCCYGASSPLSDSPWYLDRWLELIDLFKGSAAFFQIGHNNNEQKPLPVFSPKSTIREMMALIWASDIYVGFDTGPSHIAAALEKPSVVLWDALRKVELEEDKHPGFSTAMINRWAYPQNENLMILGERNREVLNAVIDYIVEQCMKFGCPGFYPNLRFGK